NGGAEEGIYDPSVGRSRHLEIVGLNRQEVVTLRVNEPSPLFKVWVKSELPPEEMDVELWTEVIEGRFRSRNWHAVPMHYAGEDPRQQAFLFEASIIPKMEGKYEYTIRIAPKNRPILPAAQPEEWFGSWIWLNGNADNPSFEVLPSNEVRSEVRSSDSENKGFKGYILNYGQRNFVVSTKQIKNIWKAVKNSLEPLYSQAEVLDRPERDDFDRFFRILWEAGPRVLDPREGEDIPNSVSQFAHEIGVERLPVVVLDPALVQEQGLDEKRMERLKELQALLAIDAIYLIYDSLGFPAGFVVYAFVNGGAPKPVVQQKIVTEKKPVSEADHAAQAPPAVWQGLFDMIGQNGQWRREAGKTVLAHDVIVLREGYLKAGWSPESSWKSFGENQEAISLLEAFFKRIHPKNTPGSRSRGLIFRHGLDAQALRRALTYLLEPLSGASASSTDENNFAFSRWQAVSFQRHGNEMTGAATPTERNIIVNALVDLDLAKEPRSGSLVYEVAPDVKKSGEPAQRREISKITEIPSLYDVRFLNAAIRGPQGKAMVKQRQDIEFQLRQILSETGALQRTERKRGEWYPLLSRDVGQGKRASYRLFLYPFDERTLAVAGFFHKDDLEKGKAGYRYLQNVKRSIQTRRVQKKMAAPEEGQNYLLDKLNIRIVRRAEVRNERPDKITRKALMEFLSAQNPDDSPSGILRKLGKTGDLLLNRLDSMLRGYEQYGFSTKEEMWGEAVQILWLKNGYFNKALNEDADAVPLVATVLRNAFTDYNRKRHLLNHGPLGEIIPSKEPDPSDSAVFKEDQEQLEHLRKFIDQLRPDDRSLLEMKIAGKKSREIATEKGMSDVAVRGRLHKILQQLRDIKEEYDFRDKDKKRSASILQAVSRWTDQADQQIIHLYMQGYGRERIGKELQFTEQKTGYRMNKVLNQFPELRNDIEGLHDRKRRVRNQGASRSEIRIEAPNVAEVIDEVKHWIEENKYSVAEPMIISIIQKAVTELLEEIQEIAFKLDTAPVIHGLNPKQLSQVMVAVRGILVKRMAFNPYDIQDKVEASALLEQFSKDMARYVKLDKRLQTLQTSLKKLESMSHLSLPAVMSQIRKIVKWFKPLYFPNQAELSDEESDIMDGILHDMAHGAVSAVIENRLKSQQWAASEMDQGKIEKG
ncbi:MAG TPA: sigma-70 family RNA polymerase sigma factor, partial [bacterium]|nr:sigma-70 family RNA polymerase sigma factor [bacterium]